MITIELYDPPRYVDTGQTLETVGAAARLDGRPFLIVYYAFGDRYVGLHNLPREGYRLFAKLCVSVMSTKLRRLRNYDREVVEQAVEMLRAAFVLTEGAPDDPD
jgi:hypothetical protein